MKKKLNKVLISTSLILILLTSIAFASSNRMTYSGSNIGGIRSISSFSLKSSTKITVNHNTTAWNNVAASAKKLNVAVQQKHWYGYTNYGKDNFNVSGIASKSASYKIPSGTYKLYFYVTSSNGKCSINGNVK